MGTYTTNYNLFMPSIGEQGWGDLVNGNFSILDLTIKGLDTRTTALENADTAFDARLQPLEAGEFETITADEFNGGVGNFSSLSLNTRLSYNGYADVIIGYGTSGVVYATYNLFASLIPVSGVVSLKFSSTGGYIGGVNMVVLSTDGSTSTAITTIQTEYTISNALNVSIYSYHGGAGILTIGIPVLVSA